jgi:hypothetical protein
MPPRNPSRKKNKKALLSSPSSLDFVSDSPPPAPLSLSDLQESPSTIVFLISAHAMEGISNISINKPPPSIGETIQNEYNLEIPESYLNNVKIAFASDKSGICTIMHEHAKSPYQNYSTAEVDFLKIYNHFDNNENANANFNRATDDLKDMLKEQYTSSLNTIENPKPKDVADFETLIQEENVWGKENRVTKDSIDRQYQLYPEKGESPMFRCHYGVHIVSIQNHPSFTDVEKKESAWRNDENNLLFLEKRAIMKFIDDIDDSQISQEEKRTAYSILNFIEMTDTPRMFLSQLILLGFLLRFSKIIIFDPTCRSSYDETVRTTRSNKVYYSKLEEMTPAVSEKFLKSHKRRFQSEGRGRRKRRRTRKRGRVPYTF